MDSYPNVVAQPEEQEQQPAKRFRSEDAGGVPLLKLLVPNYAAGALIGKGGSVLSNLQNKYGGKISLSANKEFYPGTKERVVVLIGDACQISDITNHIMDVVAGNETLMHAHDSSKDRGREQEVKIVLTNAAAGRLIGKGGSEIKIIIEQSRAVLNLAQKDAGPVPGERVLTMSGSLDERTEGCRLVIEKIAMDESNRRNNNLRYTGFASGLQSGAASIISAASDGYSSQVGYPTKTFNDQYSSQDSSYNAAAQNPYAMDSYSNNNSDDCPLKTTVTVLMEVPDQLVTVLMGPQGKTIRDLVQFSGGARFKFSDKNDFVPGTSNRKLEIIGTMKQAQSAYSLVNQKVKSVMVLGM